jgi:hypothetical protein
MDSMDTQSQQAAVDRAVEQHIADIKDHMPETYKMIQAKAKEIGKRAFGLVRAGLKGEPNRFWAMEAGYVKGTQFNTLGMQDEVTKAMVEFGCANACIFGVPEEGGNGAA